MSKGVELDLETQEGPLCRDSSAAGRISITCGWSFKARLLECVELPDSRGHGRTAPYTWSRDPKASNGFRHARCLIGDKGHIWN